MKLYTFGLFLNLNFTSWWLRNCSFWQRRLERHSMKLKWNQAVVEILSVGYDVHYGARSIKHEVKRRFVNQLAHAHENNQLKPKSTISLVRCDDLVKLKFCGAKKDEARKSRKKRQRHSSFSSDDNA